MRSTNRRLPVILQRHGRSRYPCRIASEDLTPLFRTALAPSCKGERVAERPRISLNPGPTT